MRTIDQPTGDADGATAVVRAEPGAETVTIPDAALFAGSFGRSGSDLILEGPDGESLVVRDYFAGETLPDLVAEGARLNGETVESLAGPQAPAQYAQTGPDAGTEAIGEVTELTGSATVIRTNGAEESLALGDPIFLGDTLRTGAGSSVGVTFIDDTLFSLSEDARLIIDQLIFNPGGGGNELSLSLLQGAAAFLAGQIAPSEGEGMKVTTPVATIGVRGTSMVMFYDAVQQILDAILTEDPDGDVGVAGVLNQISSQTLSALLEGVTVTGLDQLIGPPELVDPSVLLAAKFALVVQSLSSNYANFIQNIAPEAGPQPDGGGGGGGGVGEFDPVEGTDSTVFLIGPRGELIELEVLIDAESVFPFIQEDPNLILLIQQIAEALAPPSPPSLDLDGDNDTDPTLVGGTGGTTGAEVIFTEAGGLVEGTPAVPVVDEDINIEFPGTLASATVTLTNPLDGADEGLEVDEEALPAGITAEISADGTVVTLTGVASPDDYELALQAVTYVNSSENPDETNRVVEIVVNDGSSNSNTAISTIGVTATNDPPELMAGPCIPDPVDGNPFTEDGGPVPVFDLFEITDVDNQEIASAMVTIDNPVDGEDVLSIVGDLPDGISVDPGSTATMLILTGNATLEAYQEALALVNYENTSDTPDTTPRNIVFKVNDGEDDSNELVIEVDVTAVNDAPELDEGVMLMTPEQVALFGGESGTDGAEDGDIVGTVTATDAEDAPEDLTFTIDGGSGDDIFEIDSETGVVTIASGGAKMLDFEDQSSYSLDIVTTDTGGETGSFTYMVEIKDLNDAPEVAILDSEGEPLDQICGEEDGEPISLAELQITDVDADTSSYSVTLSVEAGDLESDTTFFGSEASFSGTLAEVNAFIDSLSYVPEEDFGGIVPLSVEVTDNSTDPTQEIFEEVEIKVGPVADVPDIFVDDLTVYEDNANLMTVGSFESGPFTFVESEDNDPSAPDGAADDLGVLEPVSVLNVEASIDVSDVDVFTFTLAMSGLVNIDAFGVSPGEGTPPPGLNLVITTVPGGITVLSVADTDGSGLDLDNIFLAAGDYSVEVSSPPAADNDLGDYSLSIRTTLDPKEPAWMALGDVSQQGTLGADPAVAPTDGDFQVLLTTIGDDSAIDPKSGLPAAPITDEGSDLNSLFGFEPGELESLLTRFVDFGEGVDEQEPVEGSAIKTTFTAEAGQVLTFDWTFLTDEGDEGSLLFDSPFALIFPAKASAPLGAFPAILTDGKTAGDFVPADPATMFADQVNGTFSFTVPATGTYMLGIGVVDMDDMGLDSALAVDNVELDDAPLMDMQFDVAFFHEQFPIVIETTDEDGSEVITELKITATIDSAAPLFPLTFDGPDPTAFFTNFGQQLEDGDTITIFDDEGAFEADVAVVDNMLTLTFDETDAPTDLEPNQIGIDLGRHFSGEVTFDVMATVTDTDPEVPPAQETETNTASFTLTIEGVADKAEIVDLGAADPSETETGMAIIAVGQEDAENILLPFQAGVVDVDGSECLTQVRLTSTELDFSDDDLFWTFDDLEIGSDPELVTFDNPIGDEVEAFVSVGGPNGDVLLIEFVDPDLELREVEIGEIGIALPENLNGDFKLDIEATTEEHGGPDGLPVMAGAETATQTDWFVLRVEPMNDAPVVDGPDGNDLTTIAQDDDDPDGNFVSQILAADDVDDPTADDNAVEFAERGMAITDFDETGGTWQYSTDSGATWTDLADESPSETDAFLLGSDDKLRFLPGEGYVEDSGFGTNTPTITYHAWDGSPQPAGDVDLTALGATGGKTGFSTASQSASINVVAAVDINMVVNVGFQFGLNPSTEGTPPDLGVLLTGLMSDPGFFDDNLPPYLGFGAAIGIAAGDPLFTQTSNLDPLTPTGGENDDIADIVTTDMLVDAAVTRPPFVSGDGLTEVSSFFGLPIAEFAFQTDTSNEGAGPQFTGFTYSVMANGVTDTAMVDIKVLTDAEEGSTTVEGGAGIDILYADRTLDAFGSSLTLGKGGSDLLIGSDGGEGEDFFGGTGDDMIFGFGTNDRIGGDDNSSLLTQGGDDIAFGGGGNDFISGDTGFLPGNDDLGADPATPGSGGDDKLVGGDGKDELFGDAVDDLLAGSSGGHDMLFGGDEEGGGEGDIGNTLYGDAGDDIKGGSFGGNDKLFGDGLNDNLYGDAGGNIESSFAGDDMLFGGGGDDEIFGDAGGTIVGGEAGDDLIDGGTGNDILWGDAPVIVGGTVTGVDTFVYDLTEASGDDAIKDFEVAKDVLRLTELLPANDSIAELDLAAGFGVAQTPGAGNDVTVTLGQGGGTIVIENIGTAAGINTFQDLDDAINLEINP